MPNLTTPDLDKKDTLLTLSRQLSNPLLIDPQLWISFLYPDSSNTLFYATQRIPERPQVFRPPFSSVSRLIQGIYESDPESARTICRTRIYSTQSELTPFCRGLVRIAAKRITLLERETFSFRSLPTQAVDLTQWDAQTHPKGIIPDPLPERQSLPEWIDRTHQLTLALPRGPIRHQSNRPIVALLLAPISGTKEFELLAAASNQNSKNRTLHAEVNLIQNWYRKTQKILPPGSVILTSLKPCRMCAALIWQSSDDRQSLRVIYLENDPGKNAQNTALEPQTLDRKLASIYPDEHNLAPLLAAESYLNSQRISKTRTF